MNVANIADDATIKPKINARVFVAESIENIALTTGTEGRMPKRWAINSGCTNHFCPYKSDFVTYQAYKTPGAVQVGDARCTPSLGEGTVAITCIVDNKRVPCLIQNIQYVPGLTYGLLSCKVLNRKGLSILLEDEIARIRLKDGTVVAESLKMGKLYFLNMDNTSPAKNNNAPTINPVALIASPSFDLIHK